MRSLLQANANQNYADFDGLTALQVACSDGHADVVRLLLDFLASVDQVDARSLSRMPTARIPLSLWKASAARLPFSD